jgi:formate dehydrogenase alpha subunit
VAGLAIAFGSGAMTNSISEVEFNDLLFIIGSNTTEAHPIIGNKMKRAALRGAQLIVADPRRTELAEYAKIWLRLIPGTDAALINGIIHIIVTEGLVDKAYIEARCEGFDDMWAVVKNYPPEKASEITGVPLEQLYEAARLYAKTQKAGIFYTLGITEHTTGTANVMNLANLAMVTGHVGVEHAGVNPLRGQNNVQGACDMGALPNVLPGYKSVADEANLAQFENAWGVRLSRNVGFRIPEMLDMALCGGVRAMYIMGEDPVLTDPNANHVRKALESLDFLVVQDLFMTETAKLADIFLPSACYAEKNGTFTNTERRVQRVRKAVEAPGECRADWKIICDLAGRMGSRMTYSSEEQIFEEVRGLVPIYAGITYERIEKTGLQWPCPDTSHPGTKFLHQGKFPRGKGLLRGIEYEAPAELTSDEYPILLTTGRMLYHYNIMTRHSRNLDSLRPFELAEINPADAANIGLSEGDTVRVTSRRGSIVAKVTITDKVTPGIVFMTFHYKETPVNELTNSAYDPITKTAEYKVCAIKIEKFDGQNPDLQKPVSIWQ